MLSQELDSGIVSIRDLDKLDLNDCLILGTATDPGAQNYHFTHFKSGKK